MKQKNYPKIMGINRRLITATLGFFLFIFIFFGFLRITSSLKSEETWFYFNQTESLPVGIYMKIPQFVLDLQGKTPTVQKGDYVAFLPNEKTLKLAKERKYIEENMVFLKKVGGIEGHIWSIEKTDSEDSEYSFYLNFAYYGKVFTEDKYGRTMPIQTGTFMVGKGFFLPVGEAERSFDGRYTGTVKLSNIKAIVTPVFTGLHW
ncbi:MAG: S26 family signal peptidase [Selenomonadaceae bacterium]|nr:S26 family signal peptidase [Selenomonadaceae bacterium]